MSRRKLDEDNLGHNLDFPVEVVNAIITYAYHNFLRISDVLQIAMVSKKRWKEWNDMEESEKTNIYQKMILKNELSYSLVISGTNIKNLRELYVHCLVESIYKLSNLYLLTIDSREFLEKGLVIQQPKFTIRNIADVVTPLFNNNILADDLLKNNKTLMSTLYEDIFRIFLERVKLRHSLNIQFFIVKSNGKDTPTCNVCYSFDPTKIYDYIGYVPIGFVESKRMNLNYTLPIKIKK
jgi:hypothetical protein